MKEDEKNLQYCAYWYGLSVVKEKAVDGRFRTVQYDVSAIPEDATVQLKAICFGKVKVPGMLDTVLRYVVHNNSKVLCCTCCLIKL